MNFLKLVNFEWNRLFRLLVILLVTVFAIQLIGTVYEANSYMDRMERAMQESVMSEEAALGMYGTFSFQKIISTGWFYGPIFIGIAAVMFYIFFIWYRDWFGKNTFIYRLLMLPTERVNIYLAKLVTILMMTLTFIATQLIAVLAEMKVMGWIVRDSFLHDMSVREALRSSIDTGLLFPGTFMEFVLYYGAGIMFVGAAFTAILFERSYRLKGILYGALYAAATLVVFFSPLYLNEFAFNHYFFPEEVLVATLVAGLLLLVASIGVSGYLLKKKIRV